MKRGFRVPPLRRKDIRQRASEVRQWAEVLRGRDEPFFPIAQFMDVVLPQFFPDFDLQVCTRRDLGEIHGVTYPEHQLIQIRRDVYEGALAGRGRDRMTMAHELGHLLLHRAVGLARLDGAPDDHPLGEDSEWQADAFGGELLIGAAHVAANDTEDEVASRFGVSSAAARVQLGVLYGRKKQGRNI